MRNHRLTMQDLPLADRPYEKLEMYGAKMLTEAELLAIILGSGYAGTTALALAQKVLYHYPNLADLAELSMEELQSFTGIGRSKSLRIKAALELGRRAEYVQLNEVHPTILNSKDAISYMEQDMLLLQREEFHALLLNVKGQLIRKIKISAGGLNNVNIFPRDIFREAVRANAAAMILCHNHPSGDPQPSDSDIQSTLRIQEIGMSMGIQVLDHIVIARQGSISMKGLGVI